MSDIFLSYSHRDTDDMERVRDALRAGGLAVWTDENLTPGSRNWQNAVQGAIYGAHALTVILTPISQRAVWVEREITMADENGVPIYPIVARGESRYVVPLRLINHQRYDIRTDFDAGMQSLIEGLHAAFRFDSIDQETQQAIRIARQAVAHFYEDEFQQALDLAVEALELNPDAPIPLRIHTMIHAMVGDIVGA